MSKDTAYMTADPEVVEAYAKWREDAIATHLRRRELVSAVGREIWINGSGYSTHIVGFERFESDNDGDTMHHDKSLIVSKKTGANKGMVVPNMRRKAGQEFAKELRTYTVPILDLPGCPALHVYESSHGLVMGHALIHLSPVDRVLFALWGCDNAPMDLDRWKVVPLSTYYADRERYDVEILKVSGNEEIA